MAKRLHENQKVGLARVTPHLAGSPFCDGRQGHPPTRANFSALFFFFFLSYLSFVCQFVTGPIWFPPIHYSGSARVLVYTVYMGFLNRVYGILQLKYGYSVYHFLWISGIKYTYLSFWVYLDEFWVFLGILANFFPGILVYHYPPPPPCPPWLLGTVDILSLLTPLSVQGKRALRDT